MKQPIYFKNKYDNIYFTYYNDNNKKCYEVIKQPQNYFFFSQDYTTDLIVKEKDVIRQSGNFRNKEAEKFDITFEKDVNLAQRFILDNYKTVKELEKIPIRIAYIDIECLIEGRITTDGSYPISCISVYDSFQEKLWTWVYYKTRDDFYKERGIKYFKDEELMLKSFVNFIRKNKYDILTGWNFKMFDIVYTVNRLKRFKLDQYLSLFNIVEMKWKHETSNEQDEYYIYGTNILDYMELYKKYQEGVKSSYSLNSVAEEELNETKLDFDGDLNSLYRNNIDLYVDYNRQDVMLLVKLEKKLGYMKLADEVRRLSFVNFEDILMNSIVIDNLILRFLNRSGRRVISRHYNKNETKKFAGAYVKEPIAGKYNWIITLDFASLYPNIIRTMNIGPETLVGYIENYGIQKEQYEVFIDGKKYEIASHDITNWLKEKDYLLAGNGALYRKSQKGIIAQLLKWMYDKRKHYKKLMIDNIGVDKDLEGKYYTIQWAYKILLNSVYGFIGATFTRFYKMLNAEAVTLTGQTLIKYAIDKIDNIENCSVITSDTDSVLFTSSDIKTQDDAIRIGNTIQKTVNNSLRDFVNAKFNVDPDKNYLDLEFEKLAKTGIFFVKKHYMLHLTWKEGKDIDKIDFKGVQVKKSSTSLYAKRHLVDIYKFALLENNIPKLNELVNNFYNELETADKFEIGIPISISKKLAEYTLTTPMQVRGANYWEKHYANKYNVSFENVSKGKLYFLKCYPNKKDMDELPKNKTPIICIPNGCFFDKHVRLEIDFDRTKERIIDKNLLHIQSVIDDMSLNDTIENYLPLSKSQLFSKLYNEISSDILCIPYILDGKLNLVSNIRRFQKYITSSLNDKIFNAYILYHNMDSNLMFVDLLIKYINKIPVKKNKISYIIKKRKKKLGYDKEYFNNICLLDNDRIQRMESKTTIINWTDNDIKLMAEALTINKIILEEVINE